MYQRIHPVKNQASRIHPTSSGPWQPNFSRQEKVRGPCALQMRTRRVGVKMAQAARAGLQVAAAAAFLHLFFLTNVFIASFEKGRRETGRERAREGERQGGGGDGRCHINLGDWLQCQILETFSRLIVSFPAVLFKNMEFVSYLAVLAVGGPFSQTEL